MNRIALAKYLELTGTTQKALAEKVGLTQGAIHQMIKNDRAIFVIEDNDGVVHLEETKPVGKAAGA